jgi:NTP pyrophosphatase (non-canonical NTP hydrolase)
MFGKETPETILAWNRETFGTTPLQMANRAILEVAELFMAILNEDMEDVISELADVAVMFWAVAESENIVVRLKPKLVSNEFSSVDKHHLIKSYVHLIFLDYTSFLVYRNEDETIKNNLKLIDSLDHLNSIAYILNIHLPKIVDHKMTINRSRTWKKVGESNFQHV